ncbi:putative serine acetyltransferase [Trypanosoma cruzi]|uniref:serine O-acetyltransferase n=3 Tax=Trypanosoma cruzi TaxID=5693 RepID=Q4DJX5_TRYCC|nr:serine acetyltransferase, putative [Trypanosoma cruzi]AAK16403.1 serine acetyltransferase [Trypanosoma cruzi]EAN92819.1 serine acetyltransferase, putative [Trypanosoma cruzi]KAF8296195.1 putative serine acetyltransferase [Trypanosoma cruzi]PWV15510.1 putative serine acetyltransferase [Trypanosoma cruzi]RNC54559.1 putative serine acetyltransferase [Trypanosoma cruzi]|eukprot:XP_814670.1 serine acetyltransferase [Trypanosoma cruzi strain CL Brener]
MNRLEVIRKSISYVGLDPAMFKPYPFNVSSSALSELMDCMSYIVFPEFSEPPMNPVTVPEQRLGGSALLQWTLTRMADIINSQIYSALMLQGHTKCSKDEAGIPHSLNAESGSNDDGFTPQNETHAFGEVRSFHLEAKKRAEEITEAFLTRKLRSIRWLLRTDAESILNNDIASNSLSEVVLCYPGLRCMKHQRTAHALHELGAPSIFTRLLTEMAHSTTGIDIHPATSIGHHFFIDHGTGIVIGSTAIIGNYVSIYHGVTLGTRSFPVVAKTGEKVRNLARHPIIEDRVTIYANAMVLGRIRIGKDSVIGSHCLVLKDLPPKSMIRRTSNAKLPTPYITLQKGGSDI